MGLNAQERKQANHLLKSHGFGGLEDRNLCMQLAQMVRDDKAYGNLLMKVAPEERAKAYRMLTPHLRFKARPLESYVIEAKERAEREQLPIYNSDTLQVEEFKVGEVGKKPELQLVGGTELTARATAAIQTDMEREESKGSNMEFVCAKCTKQEFFFGRTKYMACVNAEFQGWTSPEENIAICPECSGKVN